MKGYEGELGTRDLCQALDVPPRTYYRQRNPTAYPKPKRRSHRRLGQAEKEKILSILTSEGMIDMTVSEIYYTLLDQDQYYCSISTMYLILRENKAIKERRDQRKHPEYVKPVLLAKASNQVWSWDITKLPGPAKGVYYNLYSIIDIHDRFTVGWTVSEKENSSIAQDLINQTCERQDIPAEQLSIHSDRGSPMTSKSVSELLMDLGVIKSLSRPRVPNDNPFSEAQFKTLKYNRTFPKQFGCIQDARQYISQFFDWYNNDHYHSGIAMMTPATLRNGKTEEVIENRTKTLKAAVEKHPERFVKGESHPKRPASEVWINNPNKKSLKVAS